MKHCFVISNDEFENDGRILGYKAGQDANLPGYVADTELICDTFGQLGFEVKLERNKSAENMKSIVQVGSISIVPFLGDSLRPPCKKTKQLFCVFYFHFGIVILSDEFLY